MKAAFRLLVDFILMEQPQTQYISPAPDAVGRYLSVKAMSSSMTGKSQQPQGVILLLVSLCKFNSQAPMERPMCGMAMICITVLFFSLVAVLACVAAEFKRTKVEDVKLDSKLCRLPGSPSFGLGIVASICLLVTQIVGSSAFSCQFCSRQKGLGIHAKRKTTAIAFFLLSWITFGFAVLLAGVGASMNRRQFYGDGWLNGECYVVRKGVFIGSATLGVVTLFFLLGSIILMATTHCTRQEDKWRLTASSQTQPR